MSKQDIDLKALKRFMSKVKISKDGCHRWFGCCFRSGYGCFGVNGRNVPSHRFIFELKNGPLKAGEVVCHTCDVRNCVNPDHLFLGDYRLNVIDMLAKGRSGRRRLTANEVGRIRKKYAFTNVSQTDLALEFGISQSAVNLIVRDLAYRVLEDGSLPYVVGKLSASCVREIRRLFHQRLLTRCELLETYELKPAQLDFVLSTPREFRDADFAENTSIPNV